MKSWQRLILSGAVGFTGGALIGPIGTIITVALLSVLKSSKKKELEDLGENQASILCLIACMAKLNNIDGDVSDSEIKIIVEFLRDGLELNDEAMNYFCSHYENVINDNATFIDYVTIYGNLIDYNVDYSRNFIMFLLSLAHIDGNFCEIEKDAIKDAITTLKLPPDTFNVIYIKFIIEEMLDENKLNSFGTGFFINNEGFIITNHHVIKNSNKIIVLSQNHFYNATVIYSDQSYDLCLLQIDRKSIGLHFSTDDTELGMEVITYGYPQPDSQGFAPKVTQGIVSSNSGYQDDIRSFQFDAAIQPGNSGGPLVDKETGGLLGVIFSIMSKSQNVNYAIKKHILLRFLDKIPKIKDSIEYTEKSSPNSTSIYNRLGQATVQIFNCK